MEIIYRLDDEGMNLQETLLNLKHQGYKEDIRMFLEYVYLISFQEVTRKIAMDSIKGIFKQHKTPQR